MEATEASIDRRMDEKDNVYTMNYYSAIKVKEIWAICNSMDGSRGYYAKWNKPSREKNTISFHLNVEFLKQKRNRLTDTKNKLIVTREEQGCQLGEIGEEY